jgi:cysteinyl-tRNA synthetase
MLETLGLDPIAQWPAATSGGALTEVVDSLVRVVLEQREAARQRKDYAAADAIRDALTAAGLVVEDTPQGPRWTLVER